MGVVDPLLDVEQPEFQKTKISIILENNARHVEHFSSLNIVEIHGQRVVVDRSFQI